MRGTRASTGLLGLVLVAACGGGGGSGGSGTPAPLPAVTIATANNLLHTAEFVGIEKGFFLKHGVKVTLQVLQTGADINKALQSGSAQFGGGSITAIPTARQAGLDLKLFVPYMNNATTPHDDNALAVVARADSGIRQGDWASFVGKKVGLATGGTGDEYLSRWLAKAGVDRKKVTFLNVQPGDQLAAIQGKQVDAISTWEPYQTIILDKMGPDAVLVQRGGGTLGYILGLSATDEYERANAGVVQKMADSMVETEAWIRSHKREAAVIATHWIAGLDATAAAQGIQHLNFDPRVSGCTLKAFHDSTQTLVTQGKLTADIPAGDQVTARFVTKSRQTMSQAFADLPPVPSSCSA
jgi:ABC-type nitrate/sulfonate/bicarbonate transport system substrate-binding protein